MSRKEEITEQIRELTRELDGIKKVWPEEGDAYWGILPDGSIVSFSHSSLLSDERRVQRGLCFKTKEEATTYRDNDNLYVEIRQALKDANGDWVADWEDGDQLKYEILQFNHYNKSMSTTLSETSQSNKYIAKSQSIFSDLEDKYGKLPVCRAFGIIE